jgi:hypothetical protein
MAFTRAFRRLVAILRRDHMLRDLEDEMRLHVELRAKRLEREGWSPADAPPAARARFGSSARVAEESRDAWGAHLVDVVAHDLRYAARALRRTPGFATIVVLTLALGLGVNAAVFSFVSHLFADAPPGILEPHQIRRVYVSQNTHAGAVDVRNRFNYPEVADLRAAIGGSVPMTSYLADSALVGDAETGRFVTVGYTDAEYWRVLGVRPAMGRMYASTEARIEVPVFTAVISDAFWHRELGGRADVLGHTIEVAGHRTTVIGVAPPGFAGPDLDRTDVWLPLGAMPMAQYGSRAWYQIRGVSRLDVLLRVGSQDAMQRVEAQLTSVYRHGSVAAGYARDSSAHVLTGPIAVALGPMTPRREAVIATRLAWISAPAPQEGHVRASGAPQAMQKRALGALPAPHLPQSPAPMSFSLPRGVSGTGAPTPAPSPLSHLRPAPGPSRRLRRSRRRRDPPLPRSPSARRRTAASSASGCRALR